MAAKFINQRSFFKFQPDRPIQVALVGDEADNAKDWMRSINALPNFNCVCCCTSAEQAMVMIAQKQPDVVLMDVSLPRMSGIECTARLKAQLPNLQIVIFTVRTDPDLLFLSLEAGADGYLLKQMDPVGLRDAILEVLRGGVPLSPSISRCLVESFRKKGKNNSEAIMLSVREEQILRLVSKGQSNRQIAKRLNIGIETVATHMKLLFKKLQVNSRTGAVMSYFNLKIPASERECAEASGGTMLSGRLEGDVLAKNSLVAMSAYSMV